MSHISIDQLKPGMVLATDVTDTNGRLLLSKEQSIAHKHLTIFKMWGVPEVQVHQLGMARTRPGAFRPLLRLCRDVLSTSP